MQSQLVSTSSLSRAHHSTPPRRQSIYRSDRTYHARSAALHLALHSRTSYYHTARCAHADARERAREHDLHRVREAQAWHPALALSQARCTSAPAARARRTARRASYLRAAQLVQPPPQSAQPLAQPWMKKQLRFAPQPLQAGRAAARACPPQQASS